MTELQFNTFAQLEWESIYNAIEQSILPGGSFADNRDYASKVAENIARLAGVMHAFEGFEGHKISHETLCSAAAIVRWYAEEFIRLFSPPSPGELIRQHALELDSWLISYVKETKQLSIRKNELLQFGPNKLRKKEIMNAALRQLEEGQRLHCQTYLANNLLPAHGARCRGVSIIQLNPSYYWNIANGNLPMGIFPL